MTFLILLLTVFCALIHPLSAFAPCSRVPLTSSSSRCRPLSVLFSSSSNNTEKVDQQRQDLKKQVFAAADEFNSIQSDLTNAVAYETKMADDADNVKEDTGRFYYVKLLKRVIGKIMGRKSKKKKKTQKILSTDSFGTLKLEVGEAGNKTIAIAEQLAALNPTPIPCNGWQGYNGASPSDCLLDGTWKLKFTTAADATFPENPQRGKATTSQEVDATAGTLTNVVDFEKGKTQGFRVVVAGKAVSDAEIELTFQRVVIFRNSRILKKIVFPIPTRLFRLINKISSRGKASKRGPYFKLQYLDEDMRMHKTGEGNWFIHERIM